VERLVEMVHESFEFLEAEMILERVMAWGIHSHANVLRQLCAVGHERVAVRFMENYPQFSSWDFFLECITQEK